MIKTETLVKAALTLMVCGMLAAPMTADAGRFRGTDGGTGGESLYNHRGTGPGTGFVDSTGDGLNDTPLMERVGFVDADGDGRNDTPLMDRAGFVDANGDNLNDNYVDSNGDGACDISGLAPGEGAGTGYRGGR